MLFPDKEGARCMVGVEDLEVEDKTSRAGLLVKEIKDLVTVV